MASRPEVIRRVVSKLDDFAQEIEHKSKEDFTNIIQQSQETVEAVKESVEEVLENQRYTNLENTYRFQTLENTVWELEEAERMFGELLDDWDESQANFKDGLFSSIDDVCNQLANAEFPPMMPGGGRKRKVKPQPAELVVQ